MSKNPKLRKNGGEGTRIGNLLRSINFTKVTEVVADVLSGDFKSAIETIRNSGELSAEQIKMAEKELEYDMIEMQEVTKRWLSDNDTESFLTRNIRPLTLAFLSLTMFIYIILDSSLEGFKIDEQWISLLGNLLMLAFGGYFGARSVEKIFKNK